MITTSTKPSGQQELLRHEVKRLNELTRQAPGIAPLSFECAYCEASYNEFEVLLAHWKLQHGGLEHETVWQVE